VEKFYRRTLNFSHESFAGYLAAAVWVSAMAGLDRMRTARRSGKRASAQSNQVFNALKFPLQAQIATARRAHGSTGKETGKVNQIEPVGHVEKVGLQAHRLFIALAQNDSRRRIQRKTRADTASGEIYPVQDFGEADASVEQQIVIDGGRTAQIVCETALEVDLRTY